MIAFDRKLLILSPTVQIKSLGGWFWFTVATVYFVYHTLLLVYMQTTVVPKYDVGHLLENIFSVPRITDFIVVYTLCFYLSHLGCRFSALNAFWKRPMAGLLADPRRWHANDVAVLVECTRLLHAELSDLLRVLNFAYGPVLLALFASIVFDMTFHFFILLFVKKLDVVPAIALDTANVFFIVCVLSFATRVNEQVSSMLL